MQTSTPLTLFGIDFGTRKIGVAVGQTLTRTATDIAVGGSTTVSGKDAQLATASRITGTVTGPDGVGIPEVRVSAYQKYSGSSHWSQIGLSATTNPAGDYVLSGLTAGTYRVSCSYHPQMEAALRISGAAS